MSLFADLQSDAHLFHLSRRLGIVVAALILAVILAVAVQWFLYHNASAVIPVEAPAAASQQLSETQKLDVMQSLAATSSVSAAGPSVNERVKILESQSATASTTGLSREEKIRILTSGN